MSIIYAIYTPIGIGFGHPTYQHIASLFATDWLESKEFLSLIPLKHYLYGISILLITICCRIIIVKTRINLLRNKSFILLSIIVISFSLSPFNFFVNVSDGWNKVKKEMDILSTTNKSAWGSSSLTTQSKYDDYVLIIGESARRDYHHAYGYPIENTPFMSSSNGTLIDGLTSAGSYTIGSLKLMLTKPTIGDWQKNGEKAWKENYTLNLIDLMNSAGIETIWLSNQGFMGKWDTPISSIANKANRKFFLKKTESTEANTSDFELLEKFKEFISLPTKKKRFIVLHLYGSHPNACSRISDYKTIIASNEINPKYRYINCYVSSIKKTDEFIEKTYSILNLNKNNRTFSLVYFSDHGNVHKKEKNGEIILNNYERSKYHFNIPLFKISSDDTEKTVIKANKSGLHFTNGIANWVGIHNPILDKNINLFSNINDPDYGLFETIKKIQVDDPAIDIQQ
ncbi:TPA: phosphoethanolamine transferase [Mannheimia haemolytica]